MSKFWKALTYVLGAFTFVAIGLLLVAFVFSDRLTMRETAERVMAADEPCRAGYAKVVEMQEARAPATDLQEAARTGEPICRASFKTLDDINIFIPSRGGSDARDKKAAIDNCAALSKARAEILAVLAAGQADPARMQALDTELGRADEACQASFARIARRV